MTNLVINEVIEFAYNDSGYRTYTKIATNSNNYTEYFYYLDGDKVIYEKIVKTTNGVITTTDKIYYTYDADNTLISMNYKGEEYFYVRNLQQDIIALANKYGTIVVEYGYDSWGNQLYCTGTESNTIGKINPYRYRGYRYDKESNYYYLNSRYYNPQIMRFINADGIVGDTGDLLSHNMYSYCENNPITRSDGSGYFWNFVIGGVIGGLVELGSQLLSGDEINWQKVGVAALEGGVSATLGPIGEALVSGVSSVAMDLIDGNIKSLGDVARTFSVGAATSIGMAGIGKGLKKLKGAGNALEGAGKAGKYLDDVPACFFAGTLVKTADGDKPIEEIKEGDLVYAENPETGEKGLKKVVRTFIHEKDESVHIRVNGEEIITTPEHPFYIPEVGWTAAIDLRAGDRLVLLSGEIVVIEFVQHELLENPIFVYNFEVEDYHTYYVSESGILVHNECFKALNETKFMKDNNMTSDMFHEYKKHLIKDSGINKNIIGKNPDIWVHKDTFQIDFKSTSSSGKKGFYVTDIYETYYKIRW